MAQDPCEEAGWELSFSVEMVECKGASTGAVTVNSTGCECFFSGCEFNWSNGMEFHTIEDIPAGEYSVTVNHPDGCVLEGTVVVPENDYFIESVDVSEIKCSGDFSGAIQINQVPLTGQLDILWNTGHTGYSIDGLGPGVYEYTATNYLGCSETFSVDLTNPEPLNVTAQIEEQPCNGESNGVVSIDPTGGAGPYVIFWDNGNPSVEMDITNVAAGAHTYMIMDNNQCEFYGSIQIEEAEIEASVSVDKPIICNDEVALLSASGGDTYSWTPTTGLNNASVASPSVSISQTTTYQVEITAANGCSRTLEQTIQVFEMDDPEVQLSSPILCEGSEVEISAVVDDMDCTYTWFPTVGLSTSEGETVLASPEVTTTYLVTATDNQNGCQTTTGVTVVVEVCSGIEDRATALTVYPNPSASGIFTINSDTNLNKVQVYDLLGKAVTGFDFQSASNNAYRIDLGNTTDGIYFLTALNESGQSQVIKLIKE